MLKAWSGNELKFETYSSCFNTHINALDINVDFSAWVRYRFGRSLFSNKYVSSSLLHELSRQIYLRTDSSAGRAWIVSAWYLIAQVYRRILVWNLEGVLALCICWVKWSWLPLSCHWSSWLFPIITVVMIMIACLLDWRVPLRYRYGSWSHPVELFLAEPVML
jgi:hypothetical protein